VDSDQPVACSTNSWMWRHTPVTHHVTTAAPPLPRSCCVVCTLRAAPPIPSCIHLSPALFLHACSTPRPHCCHALLPCAAIPFPSRRAAAFSPCTCPTTSSLVPLTTPIQSTPGCCTLRRHRSTGESSPHCAHDSLCSVSRPCYSFFPLFSRPNTCLVVVECCTLSHSPLHSSHLQACSLHARTSPTPSSSSPASHIPCLHCHLIPFPQMPLGHLTSCWHQSRCYSASPACQSTQYPTLLPRLPCFCLTFVVHTTLQALGRIDLTAAAAA
jgi:hypothetical protein